MKILVAEDDLTTRTLLSGVLTRWGYEVVPADDGRQAWERLQEPEAPQLAVVDWVMPEMSGPELCRKLRAQERESPLFILLLTSKGEPQDIVEGLEAGGDDYLTKPPDNEELRARLNAGRRMLELQAALAQKKKLQGALEMAGAVCHELNQPVQSVLGFSELLLMDLSPADPGYDLLKNIKIASERIGMLTGRIMKITKYRTKEYLAGVGQIIDINEASEPEGGPELLAHKEA